MVARVPALLVLSVFLASTVLAGCIQAPSDKPALPAVPQTFEARLLGALGSLPAPQYDRMAGANWWENFVRTYQYRTWSTPQNLMAAQYLASELTSAGYTVKTITYQAGARGTTVPGNYLLVQGIKLGKTNPDHHLALIAHYDTVPQTAEGAYDDGAGTAAEMQICKTLAKVETNKTIECDFFDGEEQGLVASQAYATEYAKGQMGYWIDQGFGYDMTGLNWPGFTTWKLYAMVGTQNAALSEFTEPHQHFMNVTLYGFLGPKLGVTEQGVQTLPIHDRNSDEQNFKRIGIPVIRFAGGRAAADYPMYHQPGDVFPYVYSYACNMCTDQAVGKEAFAKGFEMVVLTSYYTILAWDKFDPKQVDL